MSNDERTRPVSAAELTDAELEAVVGGMGKNDAGPAPSSGGKSVREMAAERARQARLNRPIR